MIDSIRETAREYGYRRIAQAVAVLGFFGFFLGTGGWRLLAFPVVGWFEGGLGLVDPEKLAIHRVHDMSFAAIIWAIALGMLVQLRAPTRNVAGQLMAVVPFVALLVAFALTDFWRMLPIVGILGAFVLAATVLHPAGRALVTWPSTARVSVVLLVLVVVAAGPVLAFSASQVDLQTSDHADHDHGGSGADAEEHAEHVEAGHFMLMAAWGILVVGLGMLASLRPDGWWLPAWFTGAMVVLYGLASITFPEVASSAGRMWGAAAVAWGFGFVTVAEYTRYSDMPSAYGPIGESSAADQ